MPPYYMGKDYMGIELEIIRAAFKASSIELDQIRNINYKRAMTLLSKNEIHAVVDNYSNDIYNGQTGVLQSEPTLNYFDCAVSLKEKRINMSDMKSFSNHSVWAFKSARDVLGEDFKTAIEGNALYSEDHDQLLQSKLLVNKRVDIVISDKNIFMYQLKKDFPAFDTKKLIFQSMGEKTPRNLKFKDTYYLKSFNEGLKKIKSNGVYQKIHDNYKSFYTTEC
ncbi:ABC transporter, substrate-binding protein, family 3 [Bacteriovorax sp. Seq25_V]|nr:ABC transporter, substrate-binding protein, family 3 [Bacteriovorax sp. Seq25_V]